MPRNSFIIFTFVFLGMSSAHAIDCKNNLASDERQGPRPSTIARDGGIDFFALSLPPDFLERLPSSYYVPARQAPSSRQQRFEDADSLFPPSDFDGSLTPVGRYAMGDWGRMAHLMFDPCGFSNGQLNLQRHEWTPQLLFPPELLDNAVFWITDLSTTQSRRQYQESHGAREDALFDSELHDTKALRAIFLRTGAKDFKVSLADKVPLEWTQVVWVPQPLIGSRRLDEVTYDGLVTALKNDGAVLGSTMLANWGLELPDWAAVSDEASSGL